MKHGETREWGDDIPRQPALRKIHPMNTSAIKHLAATALLLGIGVVHAATAAPPATEISQGDTPRVHRPYGSGYEARGLGASAHRAAEVPDSPVDADLYRLRERNATSGSNAASNSGGSGSTGSNGSGGSSSGRGR